MIEKHDKSSVQYSRGRPESCCGVCDHYMDHRCLKVSGFIDPKMWCKLFHPFGMDQHGTSSMMGRRNRSAGSMFNQIHNDELGPIRRFYMIRHGATALNSEDAAIDRIRGWKDIPLSDKGRDEAIKMARGLDQSGIEILVHSDLSRAVDTAAPIAKVTGAVMVSSRKLRPWNVGDYTGMDSKTAHPLLRDFAMKYPDRKIKGGESFNQFKHRIFDGLKEAFELSRGSRLGIVTHHRVERVLSSWIKDGQNTDGGVDMQVMFTRGERPGSAWKMVIDENKLEKVTS